MGVITYYDMIKTYLKINMNSNLKTNKNNIIYLMQV